MNDQQLDQVLCEWKATPRTPVDFRARVWERIAEQQEAREQSLVVQFQRWLGSLFLKPAPIVALAAVTLTLGAGAGWWKGTADREEAWHELEARYVQSIDPYARTAR